jgi:hypothetical protein
MLRLLAPVVALTGCANAMTDPMSEPAADATPSPADLAPDQAPLPPAPAVWLLVNDTVAATNELVRLDPTTFAVQDHRNLNYPGALWELAGTGSTRAYAIDRDLDRLLAIDLEAGAIVGTVQLAGDMQQNGRGFGVAPDGTLWGNFAGTLAQIDPATGALSHQVTQQLGTRGEALETCAGQLYMTSRETGTPRGEKLYAVDPATGAAALRGMIGTVAIDIDTLACAGDALLGLDTDPAIGKTLYRIATATGSSSVAAELAVIGDVNGVHVTPSEIVLE